MKSAEYSGHAVWGLVDQLKQDIEGDLRPWDDDARYFVHRLHSLVEVLEALRDIDPVLIEPQALQDLQGPLQQVQNPLRQYVADPEAQQAQLQTAAAAVAGVLNVLRSHFEWRVPDEAARGTKAAATRYRNSLDAEAERLRDEVTDLREQLSEEKEGRASDATKAKERLDDLQQEIESKGTEIDGLVTKLNSQIDEQRAAFEAESQTRSEAFRKQQEASRDAHANQVDEIETAEETRREEVRQRDETAHTSSQEAAKDLIEQLEAYRDQAKKLVDTTSRHAVAGDYGTWASKQGRSGLAWTLLAVAIGLGTVVGLVVALAEAGDDSVQFTLYKTSIAVVGLIVAGYAARQAAEHRREERTAKRLALDLAALGPFLEQVEDAEELRKQVANRVFVPSAEDGQSGRDEGRIRLRGGSMSVAELVQLIGRSNGQ